MKHLDDNTLRPYIPSPTEGHKSLVLGTNLLTPYIPLNSRGILIQATADEVRYTLDGTTPTAAKGFRLLLDVPVFIELNGKTVLKLFGEGATSAVEYQIFE